MANTSKKPQPEDEDIIDLSKDVLIREVDDELRAEKLQQWWQRFGSLLVGGCVAIVLATIAYQLATSYRHSQAEDRTAILLAAQSAVDKGQTDTALKELAKLKDDSSGAGAMAKLQEAYLQKDTAALKALAEDRSAPEVIRDLARLQTGQYDAISDDSVFFPLAGEQMAVALMQQGKKDEARIQINALLDRDDIPASQRNRLNELLQGVN